MFFLGKEYGFLTYYVSKILFIFKHMSLVTVATVTEILKLQLMFSDAVFRLC